MSDEFLFGVPPSAIMDVLHQIPKGEPYSESAAIMSLMLDIDSNDVKQKRDYERIWSWSEKRVRYHWDRLVAEATKWLSWNGRKRKIIGATQGRHKGDSGASLDHVSPLSPLPKGDGGATVGRHKGDHTIQNSELQNSEEEHSLPSVENVARPKGRQVPKLKFTDWDLDAATACEQRLIAAGNLNRELTDGEREQWADVFRKLRELDHKTKERIAFVMKFVFDVDDWWVPTGNFCTAMKLRDKKHGQTLFERLEVKALKHKSGDASGNGRRGSGSVEDEIAKTVAAYADIDGGSG